MTRKKCRQKITSFLVIMAMVITCISPLGATAAEPSYAQDAETTVNAGKAVYSDMNSIYGYDSTTKSYDYIWFGNYKDGTDDKDSMGSSLKWRVLDDQTNTGGDGYYLLACGTVDRIYFERTGDQVDRGAYTEYIYSTLWAQSDARMWCQDFSGVTTGSYKWDSTPRAFTGLEQAAIMPTSKSDASYVSKYKDWLGNSHEDAFMGYDSILNNDKVFLPSAEELCSEAYGIMRENVEVYTYLRSYPLKYDDKDLKVGQMGYDVFSGHPAISVVNAFSEIFEKELSELMQKEYANSYSVTPALNLAPIKALYTTAADNSGLVDFAPTKEYNGSEWKLTLKDGNSFANEAALSGNKTTFKPGDSLTVTHKALKSISTDYTNVTAALIDESGNVCAYGSINTDKAATSSTFTIPAGCADGKYKLRISGEDWNAAYNTNYATGTPFETTIQVTTKVNLTGEVGITGTLAVGETLTANVSNSNGSGTLEYNWYHEGSEASLGTGNTYKLTADDYGKNITCKVTSSQHLGAISKTVGPVAKGTPVIGTVTANELSDTLDVTKVALSRTDETVAGDLKLTDTELQYGTHEYNWKFTPDKAGYREITGTVSITVKDTIAPAAECKINESALREFANKISFGIFCKDTAVLKITAEDSGSGVDSIKYYISKNEAADPAAIAAWEPYTNNVALDQKSANYVYVQVKDKAGNTAIYADGVVVYTESTAVTAEVEYSFKEGKDIEVSVELNGNTVKSVTAQDQDPLVRSSGSTLTEGTDYTVDAADNKIILKSAYLDTLKARDTAYSFQVKYSPVGIDTDKVNMATSFGVKVSKADLVPEDGNVTASGTYGDKLSKLTVAGPAVKSNGNNVSGKWVLTGDTVPAVGDTGSYEAKFVPDADADNYNELTKVVVLDIAKAEAEYTAPAAETGLEYKKDKQHELISGGSTDHGTMKYAVGTSNTAAPENGWSTELPKGKNAGTYYVWYKVSGDANHNDSEAKCVEVNIAKANASDVTLPEQGYVYTIATTGNVQELSTKVPEDCGTATYAINTGDSNLGTYIVNVKVDGNGKLTYDTEKASAPIDGLYITVTVKSENYNDFDVKLPVKLSDKEIVDITLPTVQNGIYNHEPHTGYTGAPAVAGHNVAFGITYEGTDGTVYSKTTEKPVNAGNYKVTFTVNDDRMQGSASLEFSIMKGAPALRDVKADVLENTTDTDAVKITYKTDDWAKGNLTIDNGQNLVYGNNSIKYTFTPDDTQNLNTVAGTVNVLVKDTISPSVTIKAVEKEWKTFFDKITFSLLFNKTQQVTITYADNQGGSGLKEMLYYVSDKELTAGELDAVTWKSYNGEFSIDPDGEYVIYAKAVDNYGNSVIVNSDGIKLDATKPLLSGISDGEVYYGDLTIQTSEEHQDVKDVEVDGVPVEFENGKYTLPADNGMHTIVVTDNAGNETTYNITVFKIYDVTFIVDGVEYLKVQVNHGADAQLPEIPHKAGYDKTAPTWDHDGKSITEDTEINALYIKNPPEESAETGDDSGFILWGMMALISMGLAAAIISTRKKYN